MSWILIACFIHRIAIVILKVIPGNHIRSQRLMTVVSSCINHCHNNALRAFIARALPSFLCLNLCNGPLSFQRGHAHWCREGSKLKVWNDIFNSSLREQGHQSLWFLVFGNIHLHQRCNRIVIHHLQTQGFACPHIVNEIQTVCILILH